MEPRSRSTLALLPPLMCLACGAHSTATPQPTSDVSIAPTRILEAYFAPPARELQLLATTFIKATCEYNAATEDHLAFLDDVALLVTPAELERLEDSSRARLPSTVLRDRSERTEVTIDGISKTTAPPPSERLIARITVTTHTSFATVQALELVTLTLVPTEAGWKVSYATGAGL